MRLDILYQDNEFVAIYKPSGLLVHRTFLDARETRFCVQILRDQLGTEVFPCHRLDKPTSGILLFAFTRAALKHAQAAFADGRACKHYLAIVRGWIEESGIIDSPLRYENDDFDHRTSGRIQEAKTSYNRLAITEIQIPAGRYPTARYSLVELLPATGRKHQLRRHLAHIRHPIVGDTRHGDGAQNRFFRDHFDSHRLLLVATELGFPEDTLLQKIRITTRPDTRFIDLAEQTGLSIPTV